MKTQELPYQVETHYRHFEPEELDNMYESSILNEFDSMENLFINFNKNEKRKSREKSHQTSGIFTIVPIHA